MLKKSARGILASLRGSTYRSVRLASSLAAALLDGLFEHPASVLSPYPKRVNHRSSCCAKMVFRIRLERQLHQRKLSAADLQAIGSSGHNGQHGIRIALLLFIDL